jgi:hypothetical protein
LTKASRHDCRDVLDGPFTEGMGSERYMKELYVVDVCMIVAGIVKCLRTSKKDPNPPYDMSNTPTDS